MSLNMYLGETDAQTQSMNAIHIEMIQSMEQVMNSIDSFTGAIFLQGKTYKSAKMYISLTFRPLAQGIIDLCEELIRQNDSYPSDFRAQVATTDVVESEIRMQIDKVNLLIEKCETMNDTLPLFGISIAIYQQMKRALERKLELLFEYNITTASNYNLALDLANGVLAGLNQIKNNNGFNSKDGTFSTKALDLDWMTTLNDAQNKIKVKRSYPDYFAENEDNEANINKAIEVIKYEEENPEYVEDTNNFLSPLEEKDIVEIKYLMYTAEEPYRTLAVKYLDRFDIASINESGVFRSSEDSVRFDIKSDRKDPRGSYYTFFHEVGHAIDYYSGQDIGMDGNFSTYYEIGGYNLNHHIYNDAKNNFRKEVGDALQSPEYDHLTDTKKNEVIHNITDNFMNQDDFILSLSTEERELSRSIRRKYKEDLLAGATHNTASDIYGGVTNFVVRGGYGHQNEDGSPSEYWIEDGERIREPNKEAFAEYYGRLMVAEGNKKQAGIDSIEEFLPSSKEHMDEIFDAMIEGDNN